MRQELAIVQQKYFTPESTFPGLPIDPEGGAGRAAAQDGASGAGDAFPADYSLQDSSGRDVDLRTLLRRGPLIVVFFRGSWCTLCNLALRHLSSCLPMFQRAFGANLIAISSQLPHHNHASELANQLSFPVLCDRGLALAQGLGLCFRLTEQESRFYDFICNPSFDGVYGPDHGFQLALPATFVLAQDTGRIGYAFVDQDLTKRSRLLRIEAALQDLALNGGGLPLPCQPPLPPQQQQEEAGVEGERSAQQQNSAVQY